jgi:hypothetical protein
MEHEAYLCQRDQNLNFGFKKHDSHIDTAQDEELKKTRELIEGIKVLLGIGGE